MGAGKAGPNTHRISKRRGKGYLQRLLVTGATAGSGAFHLYARAPWVQEMLKRHPKKLVATEDHNITASVNSAAYRYADRPV